MSFMMLVEDLPLIDHLHTVEFKDLPSLAIKMGVLMLKHPKTHFSYAPYQDHKVFNSSNIKALKPNRRVSSKAIPDEVVEGEEPIVNYGNQ